MAKASTIQRLPTEVRERITALRDQGRTIDEIMAVLDTLDVDVSRAALGRHLKKHSQVAEQVRKSRQLAESIGRTFGDTETSQVQRTNIELLHSLMMKFMIGPEDADGTVEIDSKDAMFLATAVEKLAKASKTDLETQIKSAVETERRATITKAADKMEDAARKSGISAETVRSIKAEILGLAT